MTTPRWKAQLQPASFRGIRFFISDAETVFGRRNVLHEYPMRDEPFAEDLGKKAREYNFNAYMVGENCIEDTKALMKSIEEDNTPGVLVHPILGIMNVIPKECRVVHNNQEGGIEYLTLSFAEAGKNNKPTAVVDSQEKIITVTNDSLDKAKESFEDNFATEGFSDYVSRKAQDTLIGSSSSGGDVIFQDNSLFGVLLNIIGKGAYFAGSSSNYSTFRNNLDQFASDVPDLVAEPTELSGRIVDVVQGLSSIYPDNPAQKVKAQKQLASTFGLELNAIPPTTTTIPVTTPARTQLSVNQQQLIDLVAVTALIQLVLAVGETEFESRQDALALMDEIENLMEPKLIELGDAGYDEMFIALTNARAAMVVDIKTRAATLKTVKFIKNYYTVPALVMAYQQYQDATQDTDIINRNKVRNPLFVPSNRDIEILV